MNETQKLRISFEIALSIVNPEGGQHNPILCSSSLEAVIARFQDAYDAITECEKKLLPKKGSHEAK